MTFTQILDKYRKISFSERDKGERFERLMKSFLQTAPIYEHKFKKIWLWEEFPFTDELGGNDTGIDIIALTNENEYWAIQCKCYQETSSISKAHVDTFLSTSSRFFRIETGELIPFTHRLWISTSDNYTANAEDAFRNQQTPISRITAYDLENAAVDWDKLDQGITGTIARTAKKQLRPHQTEALTLTNTHFQTQDRGKLIMACGTGKTFTSLRIAEKETNGDGLVLFLVPSIALLGQTLNEWHSDAVDPITAICVCSDPEVSKKKKQTEDKDLTSVTDLALPASTNVDAILKQFQALDFYTQKGLKVVFSTYQSIERIAEAQKKLADIGSKYAEFDLIICDEAHRTTGVSLADEDESAFTKVHSNDFIKSKKRLYMTATPRLYDDSTKSKAAQAEAVLCSMDDVSLYGEEIYRIGFGEAVEKDLLTDYKVLILTLNQSDVPPAVQKMIMDKDSEINSDDASKLIGCINALSKQILGDEGMIKETDPEPMRRAVAFCRSISDSRKITNTFNTAAQVYINELPSDKRKTMQIISAQHVDGGMNASKRDGLLSWLKSDMKENECRMLTNVRCLSEGVDVPSLDAVLFLSARNSQVDVVQSVGRVMRKAKGKKYGYIIIPIVVPSDVEANQALDDNERYKVVWTVLNALRAHDDRFNATVNKIELNKNRPDQILVGGAEYGFDGEGNPIRKDDYEGGSNSKSIALQLNLQFKELQSVVFARMVQKVGDRRYWEQWAKSVAEIAQRQTERITKLIKEDAKHQKAFDSFLIGLHKNINPSISENEAIEMLSQHIITKPVFDALFENYSFVQNNPMSQSMQKMLDLLEEQSLEKDAQTLDKFYQSVRTRASGIDNAEGKQRIIIELYDKFFKTAFPKMVEKLGIVYTPVEVVDFIIHSVADILEKEFGRSISDENIHILDPFTGTGTFITRLLQSGRISPEDIQRKYNSEIHCNEIVLLAYYIAAVNIENTYHDILGKDAAYQSFEGICLTDTFQLSESKEGTIQYSEMFVKNSERVEKQKKAPLKIIIGNPPYSIGQKSANDNAQNQSYPTLDKLIADKYAKGSNATSLKALYDPYIKAFRWSTDRLDKTGGMICFVSNGAWLETNGMDGFRKSLEKEFTSIYVFNLRGNQRTSGELSRKEGGKIFGSGSRTPISITLLVKNPDMKVDKATIHYHDIGDYLSRDEKLKIISEFKSFANKKIQFKSINSNIHGDWINHRNDIFGNFISIQPDKKFNFLSHSFFTTFAISIVTARDAWVYNYSKKILTENISKTINFYNDQVEKFHLAKTNQSNANILDIVDADSTKISWSRSLRNDANKKKKFSFDSSRIIKCLYRPFCSQNLYFSKELVNDMAVMPQFFPEKSNKNLTINVSGTGSTKDFSAIISNFVTDFQLEFNTQTFPLYYYEEAKENDLFKEEGEKDYVRRDGISDFILERAKTQYGATNITKEDIFYYVYGFLHSPEYRETFANDLKKMLPRLPLVEEVKDFWAFSRAGRELAELHINYESVAPYPNVMKVINTLTMTDTLSQMNKEELEYVHYRVDKMRFPRKDQKDTIIYNSHITIENIPLEAYDYVVNGKSAIEWIMERYQVTTHKESGITNNPNDWSLEVGKPTYILDLLMSIINVSMQTVAIIKGLPKVKFEND